MLRLIALVVPLALDSFAAACALSLGGLSRRERVRISLAFPAFEIVMPLVGLAVGRGIATAVGDAAHYAAGAVLVVLGLAILLERDVDPSGRIRRAHGLGLVVVGLAISLDELALGFAIGLLRLRLLLAIVLIAIQAVAATQLGLALGARAAGAAARVANRAAGLLLIVVGGVFLAHWL